MKRFKRLAFIPLAIVLTGCASNPTLPLSRPAADQQAQLIVFRESAFVAGGVTVTVGVNGKAFANLDNSDKATALLPAGTHEIYAQARSATPTRLSITLEPGATACLRTSASPGTYAKVLLPISLIATGYHFYLNPLPCPAKDQLAKYKDVVVVYQ